MAWLLSWTLNLAYLALLVLGWPFILWSAFRYGKHREGFAEKLLGRVPRRVGDRPCVWLHAVSVGEVNLLATMIAEFKSHRPDWEIVVSTTTKTGYNLARRKYADRPVFYFPLDFTWAVGVALRRVRPSLLVLAELELWPNLIAAARRRGVRVAIVNGRLSDKSFRRYRRVRLLIAVVLRQVDLIAAQSSEAASRFLALGARTATVRATGSLKFDGANTNRDNPRTNELQRLADLRKDDVVFLAGSTQAPEEECAINILKRLLPAYPRLRLVLVPRHPERFDEVAELLAASDTPWQRRSSLPAAKLGVAGGADTADNHPDSLGAGQGRWNILLVDTIGELGAWWGAASIGFVGGSFGSRGGQNMLEPAAYGVPICFGPNTWNFRDIVARLLAADGAARVKDASDLEAFVRAALDDPATADALGQRHRDLVLSQQGATRSTVELLADLVAGDGNRELESDRLRRGAA